MRNWQKVEHGSHDGCCVSSSQSVNDLKQSAVVASDAEYIQHQKLQLLAASSHVLMSTADTTFIVAAL